MTGEAADRIIKIVADYFAWPTADVRLGVKTVSDFLRMVEPEGVGS